MDDQEEEQYWVKEKGLGDMSWVYYKLVGDTEMHMERRANVIGVLFIDE